ncbi:MAG: HAD family phosphatase [Candidatus Bathyarchaeota archaeon]|nr:HAD family phosphatase [Candidatus Bathyarchaeota archaeon]
MIKLVIFDVDGTIFQVYSWQYIHEKLGTLRQSKQHFDQFLEKQISYEEWAQQDVALWKNQPLGKIQKLINQMPYTKGAVDTLTNLKQNNMKIFLLSAGLTQVAERIQKETGINRFLANTLVVKDGFLTGEVEVNVSFYSKDRHLQRILKEFNVTAQECAAVGDDPTLVPLFRKVTLAIAFNPVNRAVEEHADIIVKSNDLRDILPYVNEST